MIDSINELYALGWADHDRILEEISCDVAERMIDSKMPFCLVHILADRKICFEAITEYDDKNLTLNVSKRSGEITDSMKEMELSDVFYHDDFGNDGYLVYLECDSEKSLFRQIVEEIDISNFKCFLYGKIKVSEMLKLPEESYLLIDCGRFIQKIRETSQNNQGRSTKIRYR